MKNKNYVFIYIVLAAIIFAFGEIALKFSAGSLDPFQITFLRFLIGGIFLLPFSYFERKRLNKLNNDEHRFKKTDILILSFYGFLLVFVDMVFFQLAINFSEASLVAVIFSANPVFTILFSNFILKNDKINLKKLLAVLLEIVGIVIMILPYFKGDKMLGVIFAVISAVLFGLYSSIGKKTVKRIGTFTQTSLTFIIGSIFLFILILILDLPILNNTIQNIYIVLYAGVILTGLGYYFYFNAIRIAKPSIASMTFFIKIILAPIFALILLGEEINVFKVAGIILILIGSIALIFSEK